MDLNERVDRLEVVAEKTADRLTVLERDVAIIKATCATKTDLAELRSELLVAIADAKSNLTLWVVGSVFLAQIIPAVLKHFGL